MSFCVISQKPTTIPGLRALVDHGDIGAFKRKEVFGSCNRHNQQCVRRHDHVAGNESDPGENGLLNGAYRLVNRNRKSLNDPGGANGVRASLMKLRNRAHGRLRFDGQFLAKDKLIHCKSWATRLFSHPARKTGPVAPPILSMLSILEGSVIKKRIVSLCLENHSHPPYPEKGSLSG